MSSLPLDPAAVMVSISEKERKSKELRDAPFSPTVAAELHELLHRVRKEYRLLIVEFPGFNPEKKDVLGLFWKNCFYRHIEEFRKSIKKLKGQLDVNRFNQKLANHMSRLCQEFIAFLNDSSKFIQKLMNDLEKKAIDLASMNDKQYYDDLMNAVYRCLLYLGDLSRYKELYSEQEHKDFTDSVRYYEKAALLMPSSGNPHNQLAMLATYNEAESTALYHYCRSVLTQNPFSAGFENLARLFASNKQSYDSLQQQMKVQSNSNAPFPQQRHQQRKINEHLKFKFLLTSFVRLHGLLFAWTIRMHLEYLKTTEGASQDSLESSTLLVQMNDLLTKTTLGNKTEVDYEEIQELIFSILQEFDDVIYTAKLTDLHLLRFITIGMFSVHFAEMPAAGLFNDANFSTFLHHHTSSSSPSLSSTTSTAQPAPYRTIIQSLSLSAIYAIVTRAAIKLSNQLQSNVSDSSGGNSSSKRLFMEKVLPMLTIFSEWLANHPSLLLPAKEIESKPADLVTPPSVFLELQDRQRSEGILSVEMWRSRYCVRRESARLEARARSSMRSALSILKEVWDKEGLQAQPRITAEVDVEREKTAIFLREHAELRGYLPLNDQLEKYFEHFDPLRKTISWMTDAKARTMRQHIVLDFISQVLLPEAKESESTLSPGVMITSANSLRKEVRKSDKNKKGKQVSSPPAPVGNQKKKKSQQPEKDKESEKEKKRKNGHKNNLPQDREDGQGGQREDEEIEVEALEGGEDEGKSKGLLAELDFPTLPGGNVNFGNQVNDFWRGLKAPMELNDRREIVAEVVDQMVVDERWVNEVTEDLDEDDGFEDFDDVVFQPSLKRFADQTPSPFSAAAASALPPLHQSGSNSFLLGGENLSFNNSPNVNGLLGQQEHQQGDLVANDILTSLGISKNRSSSQLSDSGKHVPLPTVASTSNDLWEKLGVSGLEVANNPQMHHSLSAEWNGGLIGNALSSEWENPYQLDHTHVVPSQVPRLLPNPDVVSGFGGPPPPPPGITSLHTPPQGGHLSLQNNNNPVMRSPPGLTPSHVSSPALPLAPPGLGGFRPTTAKEETESISSPVALPRSNDFLSYLKLFQTTHSSLEKLNSRKNCCGLSSREVCGGSVEKPLLTCLHRLAGGGWASCKIAKFHFP